MSEDVPSLKKVSNLPSLKLEGVTAGYKRVRTKGMWVSFAISLIVLIIGAALIVHPIQIPVSKHISSVLQPGEELSYSIPMEKGEKLQIKGTVQGGNNDIWIYINAGFLGLEGKDFGLVESPVDVTFVAPRKGNYDLYISNKISVVTSKTVNLEAKVWKYFPEVGEFIFVGGLISVILDLIALGRGRKQLVLNIGRETYKFWIGSWGKIQAAINDVALDEKLKPGMKFKIGPNDEHLLEIKKVSWRKIGFFVDGQEVGRLP